MKYIIANWKMNLSLTDALELVSETLGFLKKQHPKISFSKYFMIAPPYPFLYPLHQLIKKNGSLLSLASQDVSSHEKGAFTGEISAQQLQEMGVQAILIGHSERRLYHHETEDLLLQKIQKSLAVGLLPIICLGESLDIRKSHQTIPFIIHQLNTLCSPLNSHAFNPGTPPFLIAYEPLWAIGTGITPSPKEIEEVHNALHQRLKSLFPTHLVPVIYGGSVTSINARDILSLPSVDGSLIGGASLSITPFLDILRNALS